MLDSHNTIFILHKTYQIEEIWKDNKRKKCFISLFYYHNYQIYGIFIRIQACYKKVHFEYISKFINTQPLKNIEHKNMCDVVWNNLRKIINYAVAIYAICKTLSYEENHKITLSQFCMEYNVDIYWKKN